MPTNDFGEGGALEAELQLSAQRLVKVAEEQGVYYAVALLHDLRYDRLRTKALLAILKDTKGAIHAQNIH